VFVNVGLAVRQDDDFLAMEVAIERVLQALGSPGSSIAIRLLLRDDPIDETAQPDDLFDLSIENAK